MLAGVALSVHTLFAGFHEQGTRRDRSEHYRAVQNVDRRMAECRRTSRENRKAACKPSQGSNEESSVRSHSCCIDTRTDQYSPTERFKHVQRCVSRSNLRHAAHPVDDSSFSSQEEPFAFVARTRTESVIDRSSPYNIIDTTAENDESVSPSSSLTSTTDVYMDAIDVLHDEQSGR